MAVGEEFFQVTDDILHNILGRLPAISFASAACVSKNWNYTCNCILSRPKFASALSLNINLHDAVEEVCAEVLSKPIRPQFAVAYIGLNFNLGETHHCITKKLGSKTPVITNEAIGIMGINVRMGELCEVKWEVIDENTEWNEHNLNRGIVLSVGFVPDLKVDVIPLLRPKSAPHVTLLDHFVMEIRHFTVSASGSTAPACIILYGDQHIDMKHIVVKLDSAMPEETAIVGDPSASFMCRRRDESQNYSRDLFHFDAVALVFARDTNKPDGIGETQFHVTLSPGIIPFGPHLRTMSVIEKDFECSWVSAILQGVDQFNAVFDCEGVFEHVKNELNDPDIYIGVAQRRNYSVGLEASSSRTNMVFHEVLGGDNEFIIVDGSGIEPGDTFLFYHSDYESATTSIEAAYVNLETLQTTRDGIHVHNNNRREVFGGFIFSSYRRGESFFKTHEVDSEPFAENFPGIPVAGLFCDGEIGRGALLGPAEYQELSSPRCCLHSYSSVYLAMSYVQAPQHYY